MDNQKEDKKEEGIIYEKIIKEKENIWYFLCGSFGLYFRL
ncbi:hypothetical protein CHCC14820_2848 [Bacillus paralicheniformis]|nr:hypothetical protein SC10_B2orf01248 [Bacillus paralicheniformis]KYC74227.1 hypothetical protein B4090_0788 [Bacillus licheniformis]OLG03448.1 hypothetical protein B4125_3692 [Bacillus paralicheniformis]TWJ66532.1 hypothetical protein CHCC5022_4108 [Bacillus paralicheniformis]TWJ71950.1 hypothetical protein CHCC4186_1782 [Bacillus paralicheniformis]